MYADITFGLKRLYITLVGVIGVMKRKLVCTKGITRYVFKHGRTTLVTAKMRHCILQVQHTCVILILNVTGQEGSIVESGTIQPL